MLFIQDILIVIAKLLIFIGDIVLLVFGVFWKLIRPIFYSVNSLIKKSAPSRKRKVIETEIFNSESEKIGSPLPKTRLNFNFKKPKITTPSLRLPRISFTLPKLRLPSFNIRTPQIKKPQMPNVSIPKPEIPKVTTPKVKTPSISLPKIVLPAFSLPSLPAFHFPHPSLPHRHKKRGRKRLPLRIPYSAKFKYLFVGATISFLFLFLPLYAYTFIKSLPNPNTLAYQETSQTTKIYDRNKILLYQIYANQNRTNVPLSKIPPYFREATIAIEDKNFYTTPGFDIQGIARSAIADISGKPLQGGSTITQQLIKTRLLTPERSFERKIKEVILAVWAEQIYSKDQILEMYFNQVPYGGTAWGAEAASQTYFGKNVDQLDLAQSAFLAGLPQAPSIYSPYANEKNLWKNRQRDVLARMVELKYITPEEAKKADAEKLEFKPNQTSIKAPHFVMYVKDLLVQKYGLPVVERGGLTVITSLDSKTQDMAQKIITDEVNNAGYLGFTNAAALVTNPKNGDILAMIGGKNYFDENGGNYNITTALRQPGSTVKVITYTAALLNGETAATVIQDTPVSFAAPGAPPYSPVNYDGRFRGNITLRNALGNSINIPAVKTLNQVGIPNMVNLAKEMGITTWGDPSQYGLAITLGAAETKMTDMATVYGTIANSGNRVDLDPILKIVTYQGAVLEEKTEPHEKRVLPDEIAFIISNILSDNSARAMEFGLNSPLNIPKHTVSVKTGTTDNKRDNWTIGFTPDLLTAVWVGNNNNAPMNPVLASGITGAAPIWNKIMNNLLANKNPNNELKNPPSNIVARPCGGKTEYFVKGTEDRGGCRPISINDQKTNP
jgi:1A family penicillin-binding protein